MSDLRWFFYKRLLSAFGRWACRHSADVEKIRAEHGMPYDVIAMKLLLALGDSRDANPA